MYCSQCGSQLPDGQLTCPVCGAYVNSNNQAMGYGQQDMQNSQMSMQNGQQEMQNGQIGYEQAGMQNQAYQQNQMNGYNQAYQQNQMNGYNQSYQQNQQVGVEQNMQSNPPRVPGMGWYTFIIYVQLFLNAILNFITSVRLLTGSQYKKGTYDMADLVYQSYPALETVDKMYGIGLLGIAIFAIVTRFLLADFKKNGPACYYTLISLNIVFSLVYLFVAASILHVSVGEVMTNQYLYQLIGCVVLLVINLIYFNNRKHLFTK